MGVAAFVRRALVDRWGAVGLGGFSARMFAGCLTCEARARSVSVVASVLFWRSGLRPLGPHKGHGFVIALQCVVRHCVSVSSLLAARVRTEKERTTNKRGVLRMACMAVRVCVCLCACAYMCSVLSSVVDSLDIVLETCGILR